MSLNYTTVTSCLKKKESLDCNSEYQCWLKWKLCPLYKDDIFSQMAKMILFSGMTTIVHKEE